MTEAIFLCTAVVGPSIGSFLLRYGPWIPVGVGVTLRLVGTLVLLIVPNVASAAQPSTVVTEDLHEPDDPPKKGSLSRFSTLQRFVTSLQVMTTNKTLALLILTFLLSGATKTWIQYFLQYISKRYGWTYAQVSTNTSFASTSD